MSDSYLVERLTDINPIPSPKPADMIVLPIDTDFISSDPEVQEQITENVIRSQSDYITSVNPIVNLHSQMNNSFYRGEMDALYLEAQNLIDYSSRLRFMNDIDYFDGDSTFFYDRINNFISLSNFSTAPTWFSAYVNQEVGDAIDITKKHDYLRNLIKHLYLLRRWAGTLNGYKTVFRLINRLGAVHLNTLYSTGTILTVNSDRKYRLLDLSKFNIALPNTEGSKFPNSPHIDGASSLRSVQGNSLYFDIGHSWDEEGLTWDESSSFLSTNKGILFDLSLDRLLHHTNSIGTTECLLEDYYLSAIDNLLPEVQRASDDVNVGAQITLVNSKDGRYNTLSNIDLYSHPNIHARCQVMKYLPDKVTPAWIGANFVEYIKVGSGAYDPTTSGTYNPNVFVKVGEDPAASSKIIPTDIANPVYESSVSVNEKLNLGNGYEMINVVIHPRSFEKKTSTAIFNVNGINTEVAHMKLGGINLVHTAITEGSLVYSIKIDVPRVFSMTVTSVAGATSGTVIVLGQEITLSSTDILSVNAVASAIESYSFEGWTLARLNNVLSFTANSPKTDLVNVTFSLGTATNIVVNIVNTQAGIENKSIFHKLLLTQKINPLTNSADPVLSKQKLYSDGSYYDVSSIATLHGYTSDSSYSLPTDAYFPSVNDDSIIFNPLYGMDKYAFFDEYIIGKYLLDDVSFIPDSISGTIYSQHLWASTDSWTGSNVNVSTGTNPTALIATIAGTNNPYIYRTMSLGTESYVRTLVSSSNSATLSIYATIGGSESLINSYSISGTKQIIDVRLPNTGVASNLKFAFSNVSLVTTISFEFIYVGDGTYESNEIVDYSDTPNDAVFSNCAIDIGLVNKKIILRDNTSRISIATSSSLRAATAFTLSFIANFSNTTSGMLVSKVKADNTVLWRLSTNGTTVTFVANRLSGSSGTWTSNTFTTGSHIVTVAYNYNDNEAPIIRIDGTKLTMTGSISGVLDTDLDASLMFGSNPSSVAYVTSFQEIRLYDEIVSSVVMSKLEDNILLRLTALTTSLGKPVYFYLDSLLGTIAFKAQYDPNGLLQDTSTAQIDHTSYNAAIEQSYAINATSTSSSAITEMGLFDINRNLVAYATFPPIIYNASKHHLSFNFLISLST